MFIKNIWNSRPLSLPRFMWKVLGEVLVHAWETPKIKAYKHSGQFTTDLLRRPYQGAFFYDVRFFGYTLQVRGNSVFAGFMNMLLAVITLVVDIMLKTPTKYIQGFKSWDRSISNLTGGVETPILRWPTAAALAIFSLAKFYVVLVESLLWTEVYAVAQIAHGLLDIVSPILRVPFRLVSTAMFGRSLIEHSKKVRNNRENVEELEKKYNKGIEQGRRTDIDSKLAQSLYREDKEAFKALFSKQYKPYKTNLYRAMWHTLGSSFKPYKHTGKVWKDLALPFRGISYVFMGAYYVVTAPFATLYSHIKWSRDRQMSMSLGRTTLFLVERLAIEEFDSVGLMLLGLSEVVAAPLIWAIRMPLRGLLTLIQGKPLIENSARIQAAVEKSETKSEDIKNVYEIHAKLHNGLAKGRVTKVDVAVEQNRWENRNEEGGIANFMQLFKKAEALDDDPLANAEESTSWIPTCLRFRSSYESH